MLSSAIDLKLRLALRVAVIAAICCAAATAWIVVEVDRSARARTDAIAEMAAKGLALQQAQARWIKVAPDWSPDLQTIAAALSAPGVCVAYRAPGGEIVQRLCDGPAPGDLGVPQVLVELYQHLFDTGASARPVVSNGAAQGEALAWIDPQTLVAQSWREASRLLAVMAGALLGLCLLTYAALARALRPTRTIRAGLERLAAGDLSTRLPAFDLAELSAIAGVFNHLVERLEAMLAERAALTQRLILVQDQERQHLARELHDEFGQCLAAISAVAASAGQTAERECPALLSECQSIARTASAMMETLRGTLLRLRPPDVAELGLPASLTSLVAGWNRRVGRTRFAIELAGSFDALPQDFAASLYRVAQEAITNAAKHAQASRVTLRLRRHDLDGADPREQIELTVDDDGKGRADPAVKPGMGLLGMRERIAALGGTLRFEPSHPSGLVLQAQIPVPPAAASAPVSREAA